MSMIDGGAINEKFFLKPKIIVVGILFLIIIVIDLFVYISRKDRIGESWFYLTEDGRYHVIYHDKEYISIDRNEFGDNFEELPVCLSEEYLTCGEPGILSFFYLNRYMDECF